MNPSHEWLGTWECIAPLTPSEWESDKPYLERLTRSIPEGVTLRDMTVWIHGREYRWDRIDATPLGGPRG